VESPDDLARQGSSRCARGKGSPSMESPSKLVRKDLSKLTKEVLKHRLQDHRKNDSILPSNGAKMLSQNLALVQSLHKMLVKCNIWK
jgi:hypothetical protein